MAALPPSPDLSFEKKQAKALVRACRAGDAAALARIRAHLPRKAAAGVSLADAEHVIARERGFASWPGRVHERVGADVDGPAPRRHRAGARDLPAVPRDAVSPGGGLGGPTVSFHHGPRRETMRSLSNRASSTSTINTGYAALR